MNGGPMTGGIPEPQPPCPSCGKQGTHDTTCQLVVWADEKRTESLATFNAQYQGSFEPSTEPTIRLDKACDDPRCPLCGEQRLKQIARAIMWCGTEQRAIELLKRFLQEK